jgi:hypothetical protein
VSGTLSIWISVHTLWRMLPRRGASLGDDAARRREAKLRRAGARPMPILRALAAGFLSIACTLTQDDFEPHEVSGLDSAPDGGASSSGVAGAATSGCTSASGCCTSSSDCTAPQVCVNGTCSAACVSGEDVSTCEVPLCPGPGCPGGSTSCTDGIQNGREPAADCGETCPERCLTGSACNANADCESLRCVGSRCAAPACDDDVRNQDESDRDCGGGCPTPCVTGAACARDADCQSGLFCAPSTQLCTDGSCQDGTQSGNEMLADCGGACPGCPLGSPCSVETDCASRLCTAGRCSEGTCSDGQSGGDESGIDCGGSDPACARCPDWEACRAASDCASGACEAGVCISCADGRRNGTETGIDCGGGNPACDACDDGAGCSIDDDCQSGDCGAGVCLAITCPDGVLNGSETDTDCGGSDLLCPRCGPGESCASDADCSTERCAGLICTTCGDGQQNGNETDTDCGGADPSCGRCAAGDTCQADTDCASGACQGGVCCGGNLGDCTRCAERLSASVNCDFPAAGVDSTGVANCNAFLSCLTNNAARCPTRNTPGCSGDNQAADACPHNNFGGNAGTGITRANQVLQNAACQL